MVLASISFWSQSVLFQARRIFLNLLSASNADMDLFGVLDHLGSIVMAFCSHRIWLRYPPPVQFRTRSLLNYINTPKVIRNGLPVPSTRCHQSHPSAQAAIPSAPTLASHTHVQLLPSTAATQRHHRLA
ncbi:hypothetical protein NX059_005808 [Plenodomus lindquistii]|nr:hypothetical protein NX059_005808 [Plenodomus lindquistii]